MLPAVLASLAGCAIFPIPYKEPVSGPVATGRFKNTSRQAMKTYVFETSRACTGRRKVGDVEPLTQIARKVPADGPVTFQYFLDQEGPYFCQVNLRFYPRRDGQYVFLGLHQPGICRWSMVDLTDPLNPAPVTPEKLKRRSAWDENSSFCEEPADFEAPSASGPDPE